VNFPGESFGSSMFDYRPTFSSIQCHVCEKLQGLVVNAGQLDSLPENGTSTMFKMMEVFGLGFVCAKCVKKGKK
jgi:hypothetical protein